MASGVPGDALVWERFVDKAVFKVQQRMFTPISKEALDQYSCLLSPTLYHEVIEERSANKLCGSPTCSEPITHDFRGQMRVSLVRKQLYSLEELNEFCSEGCLSRSKDFEAHLSDESLYGRPNIESLLKSLFPMLNDDDFRKLRRNHLLTNPALPLAPTVLVREISAPGNNPAQPKLPSRRRGPPPTAALEADSGEEVSSSSTAAQSASIVDGAAPASQSIQDGPLTTSSPLALDSKPSTAPDGPSELCDELRDLRLDGPQEDNTSDDGHQELCETKCLGPFALMWDALTDWITDRSLHYCRTGRLESLDDDADVENGGSDDEGEDESTWSAISAQRRSALHQLLAPVFPSAATGLRLTTTDPLHAVSELLNTFCYRKAIPSLDWKARQFLAYVLLHSLTPHLVSIRDNLATHGSTYVISLGFTPAEADILVGLFTPDGPACAG
eukprot:TRINITY_DN262_c0_g1_i1.p1 TRINITY_DN262_c0_g1~~TRINITY_DN262_c0_g1_i1.p1  ORF type:complete len:459 (+),score=46.22 TRINITY_DN262_c0_g1_i1:47-1378(+)